MSSFRWVTSPTKPRATKLALLAKPKLMPAYIDNEYSNFINLDLKGIEGIVSYHNFSGMPDNSLEIFSQIAVFCVGFGTEAKYYPKFVVTADNNNCLNKLRKMFNTAHNFRTKTICLLMAYDKTLEEKKIITPDEYNTSLKLSKDSRIEAYKNPNSLLTFVCIPGKESAPGQIEYELLELAVKSR